MTKSDRQDGKQDIKAFQKVQLEFAQHLRDPEHSTAPQGIEDRRLKVYRDLFFGNIKGLVSQTFPVLQKFYTSEQWDELIREFMVQHKAHTPLFLEVSSEFLKFLQTSYKTKKHDPAFMLELAHYEWVELAVSVMDTEADQGKINPDGNLLEQVPYLNPALSSLAYSFPVHQIKPEFAPDTAPEHPTFLLVFRKKDDSVEFMQLNAVSARLIELLEESNTLTGRELMLKIADELKHPEPENVVNGGLTLLQELLSKEVVLGTYK